MNTTVTALQEIKQTLERKLRLAQSSAAFHKGTNKETVRRLSRQIVAVEESISMFR